jgi:uncharacterized Zn finger protein
MTDKPEITLQQIRARASSQSFSRGEDYYDTGAITDTIRRGDEIEARCAGSYPEPYHVWAKFDGSQIVATSCTCEYDWGGDCKHIIALLLTYLHDPDQFEDRPPLHDALMQRSKEDLADIIMLMVTRYPELQDIVDRPTPNEVIRGTVALDTLSFRRELHSAFSSYDYDYYDNYGNSSDRKVAEIAAVAKRFSERGDWRSAAAVYGTILEEFAEMDQDYYHDEEGELAYAISEVVAYLDDCLKQPEISNDDAERRAIFDALLGVFIWDVNFGGVDIGMDAPEIILRHIRREDIPGIRHLVEAAREQKRSRPYSQWGVSAYNEFLIDLDMLDEVNPEIILERLRAEGMYHLLVNRLLAMERLDEAADVVRQHIPGRYERIKVLTLFIDLNYDELALQIAEEGVSLTFDVEVVSWLIDQYEERNHQQKLLYWQRLMMKHQPLAVNYEQLKITAQALNQWEALRPQIIRDLQASENYEVLTRVYLHDEQWELAWDTLPRAGKQRDSLYGRPLDFEVAEASRHALPERAIPVYIKYARKRIANRNRDQYAIAASLLATVQKLYDQLDEIEKWEILVAEIRAEFKTLRALQDELNKAGL